MYALRDGAATQRAGLQSIAADLTTADVTAGQEDDLRLETVTHGQSYGKVCVHLIMVAHHYKLER